MKYLNHFSLSSSIRPNNIKEKNFVKLVREDNFKFQIFFFVDNMILFERDKIFFYETQNLEFFKLNTFFISFIAKIKKNIFFSCSISKEEIKKIDSLYMPSFKNARDVLFSMEKNVASIMATGFQLMKWQKDNIFCSRCGAKNKFYTYDNSIICQNKKCQKRVFPRINPTVIMNVTFEDKILLARNINWKQNLYSCLAGFCEFNENAEEAVSRETFEETGLNVRKIRYIFSQTWPFQNNLMLGFEAVADSSKININKNEIEDAKWFSYSELISSVYNKELILPIKHSIARNLIYLWEKKFRNLST